MQFRNIAGSYSHISFNKPFIFISDWSIFVISTGIFGVSPYCFQEGLRTLKLTTQE